MVHAMVQTLFRFTPWFRPCSRFFGLTRTSNVVFADTVHAMVQKFKVGLNQYKKLIRSRQVLASAADRKAFILGAVQAADLRKAASRKGQSLVSQVDVPEARRTLQAVSDPTRKGALRFVFSGDCCPVHDQEVAGS